MPRKRTPSQQLRDQQGIPAMVVKEVPKLENLDTSKLESEGIPLTDAEKVEMAEAPLPSPPTVQEVIAAQDAAYQVLVEDSNKQLSEVFNAGPPASTFMEGVLKCHTCGRTGEEDLGECPNITLPNFTCPEPTAINPDTDLVLSIAELGIIRTIPVESLVKGHARNYLPGCHSDNCGYKILHPKKG